MEIRTKLILDQVVIDVYKNYSYRDLYLLMLNVRKTVSQFEGDVEVQYGKMHQIIHLLLPPFVIYLATWSWDILKSSAKNVWGKIWK